MNSGENILTEAVIDTATGFAYFTTYTSPSRVIKIRLADFTRVGAMTLNAGENLIRASAIDTGAGFAYFGTWTNPGPRNSANIN